MNIRDVADLAGVSPSTVSLVLRGADGVAADTVTVVQKTIKRFNYQPGKPGRPRKRAGAPKASKRSNRLALVAWKMSYARLNAPVYMAVVHGVEEAASRLGKTLVLRHVLPAQIADAPLNGSVDGLILFGASAAEAAQFAGVPCVQVMGPKLDSCTNWDLITYNDEHVGLLAADYLISKEHRHIAFVGMEVKTPFFTRGSACLRKAEEAGCVTHVLSEADMFIETDMFQRIDSDKMRALVDRLQALDPRPTGLFVHADALTQCLYPILIERGIRPGVDVDIVSCNNEKILLNGLNPPPATVDIHASDIGARAVEQLLRRIEHPDEPRVTLALEPELIVPN